MDKTTADYKIRRAAKKGKTSAAGISLSIGTVTCHEVNRRAMGTDSSWERCVH
jgi:hypothetical protein